MKKITTFIVDSFTDEAFKGNPAGVCLVENSLKENEMINIAKELGLSETAFVKKESSNMYTIRYFSPKMEIPLCGHATLAASKVLFNITDSLNKITFKTIENINLSIQKIEDFIQMEFPIYKTEPATVPKALLKALGIDTIENTVFNKETSILLLEISCCETLQNLSPNYEALYASHNTINGVLVTAKSNKKDFDFESRYFWPWSGTNEDPVTGGTHTFLAKYWGDKLNKKIMNSFQCSERSGFMEVNLLNDKKMYIKSKAKLILEGSILI